MTNNNFQTIYVVTKTSGGYDSITNTNVCAYFDRDKAQTECERLIEVEKVLKKAAQEISQSFHEYEKINKRPDHPEMREIIKLNKQERKQIQNKEIEGLEKKNLVQKAILENQEKMQKWQEELNVFFAGHYKSYVQIMKDNGLENLIVKVDPVSAWQTAVQGYLGDTDNSYDVEELQLS